MIIGSCGFGGTGSSIITDLLREYDDVQVFDSFEFIIPYIADGIEDLEYHLMKQYAKGESSDIAIRRFLRRAQGYKTPFIHKPCNGKLFYEYSKEFVEEVTQCKFRGVYSADVCSGYLLHDILAFGFKKVIMPQLVERIIKRRTYLWPCHDIWFSIEPENFYEAAQRYTLKILQAMGAEMSKKICLDQPFTGNAPENSMRFFDDPYAIVVDRDPRDMYLAEKYTKSPDGKFAPKGDVDAFIIYYKNMRRHIKNDSRVLRIKFEELVYEYDSSLKRIEGFLGLKSHVKPREFFNPDRSINNTQLIRLHQGDIEEIKKIEEYLSDYLFPFEEYKSATFGGKPFDGATRKSYV